MNPRAKKPHDPAAPAAPAQPSAPARPTPREFPKGLAGSGMLEGALDKIRKRRRAAQDI